MALGNPDLHDIMRLPRSRPIFDVKRNVKVEHFGTSFAQDARGLSIKTLYLELRSSEGDGIENGFLSAGALLLSTFDTVQELCSGLETIKFNFLGLMPCHDNIAASLINRLPSSVRAVEILRFESDDGAASAKDPTLFHIPKFWRAIGRVHNLEQLLLPSFNALNSRPTSTTSFQALATTIRYSKTLRHLRIGGMAAFRSCRKDTFGTLIDSVLQNGGLHSFSMNGVLRSPFGLGFDYDADYGFTETNWTVDDIITPIELEFDTKEICEKCFQKNVQSLMDVTKPSKSKWLEALIANTTSEGGPEAHRLGIRYFLLTKMVECQAALFLPRTPGEASVA